MTRTMPRVLLTVVALLASTFLLASVSFAKGVDYLGGKVRTGDSVVIPATETVRGDLYVFAGTAAVNGTVDGDLVVFGGQVAVGGRVNGSIIAGGASLVVSGQTGGAVRAAGGQVDLQGAIGRDVLVAGGQLVVSPAAKVGQDVIFATGAAALDGAVTGSVLGTTGSYTRSGSVGGTEQVEINEARGAQARIRSERQDPFVSALRQLVAVLLVGGLLLWLRPRILLAWDSLIRSRPAASLGYGVLALVGSVAAIVVALVAVVMVAIVLGILTLGALVAIDVIGGLLLISAGIFAFVVVSALVVDAMVGYSIGRALLRDTTVQLGRWNEPARLVLGVLIVVAITALPLIGGIAKLVVLLFGLGALTLHAWTVRAGPSGAPAVSA